MKVKAQKNQLFIGLSFVDVMWKPRIDDLQKEPFFIAVGLEPHHIVQLLLLVSLFPCLFNNIHLMSDPEGNSKFCFLEGPDVSRDEAEGETGLEGKQIWLVSRGIWH